MIRSSKLRVAVIGGGHLGKIHTRLMKANEAVDLVAVAEPSPLAQQAIIDEFDVEVVSDYRKLVGQVDAVVIATPTRTHFPIADFWLDNQVHCLIEKPLTDSVSDARALSDKATQNNCIVSVGHCERFNPAIRAALKVIGEAKICPSLQDERFYVSFNRHWRGARFDDPRHRFGKFDFRRRSRIRSRHWNISAQ